MGAGDMQTVVRCKKCGKTYSAGVVNRDFEGVCPGCVAGFALEDIEASPLEAPPPDVDRTTVYLKPGTVFQGVEVVAVMGQGGMGVVYKARQTGLDRQVALKVMSDRLAGDPEFVKRFEKEARAMAALSHPNIVAVYNYGCDNGRCFIVMECVDGVNLRQVMRERKLTPEEALRIVPQLCDALDYAHGEGVVHRDIKPENILLDRKGRVKITDFGLAKIVNPDRVDNTVTGLVMGTPHYMAPEQVETPKDVDHRADIYSMGVVFYELLTGQLPIGRFEVPSQRGPVDVRLDQVVMKALERAPGRRYQRAGELKTDVSRVSDHIPVARAVEDVPVRVPPPPPPPPVPAWSPVPAASAPALPQYLSRWVGTAFGLSIAALALGLVCLIIAGAVQNASAASTALIVVGGIGGLLGTIGFLCNVIGLFEILFSNGRIRGFGLAFLTFAMDMLLIFMIALGWVIVPSRDIGPRYSSDGRLLNGPVAVAGPSSTGDLFSTDVPRPQNWSGTFSRTYDDPGALEDLWATYGISEGAPDVVRARRVVYNDRMGAGADISYTVFEFRPGASREPLLAATNSREAVIDSGNLMVIVEVSDRSKLTDSEKLKKFVQQIRTALGGNIRERR